MQVIFVLCPNCEWSNYFCSLICVEMNHDGKSWKNSNPCSNSNPAHSKPGYGLVEKIVTAKIWYLYILGTARSAIAIHPILTTLQGSYPDITVLSAFQDMQQPTKDIGWLFVRTTVNCSAIQHLQWMQSRSLWRIQASRFYTLRLERQFMSCQSLLNLHNRGNVCATQIVTLEGRSGKL